MTRAILVEHGNPGIDKIKTFGWAPCQTPEKSVGDYLSWIRTDGLQGTLTKGIADLLRSPAVVEF